MFLRSLLSRDIIAQRTPRFLGTPNTHNGPERGWEFAVFLSLNPLRQTDECVIKILRGRH